jgi:hypothetical protein
LWDINLFKRSEATRRLEYEEGWMSWERLAGRVVEEGSTKDAGDGIAGMGGLMMGQS